MGTADRVQVGHELRFGREAVLEVDDQPVEADAGEDLRDDRRTEDGERPVQGLASFEAAAQVDEPRDRGEAVTISRVGHAGHDALDRVAPAAALQRVTAPGAAAFGAGCAFVGAAWVRASTGC